MGARIASNMSCVHCKTTETPLWRAGPAGPKTLCNACGVRWKKTGSVIPRAKRPSATAPSSATAPHPASASASASASTSGGDGSTGATPPSQARKRARTTPPASSTTAPHSTSPSTPSNAARSAAATTGSAQTPSHQHRHATRQRFPLPDALPLPDPAARVAAAVLPAPRPVSVFRVSDATRSKYDSVFSGLMVVNRARDAASGGINASIADKANARRDDAEDGRPRTRTQSMQTAAQQQQLLHQQWIQAREEALVPPSPSPPPVERPDRDAVYVTEVHAPSPSPSPPPMPRVQRLAEGGGFRLLLAAMVKDPKPTT